MTTAWSTSLPTAMLMVDGSGGTFGDNTIRSKPDVGPAKLRRRSTARPDTFTGSQLLTAAQIAILDTFYKTTLCGGSLPFSWKHPVSGATVDMRFLSPPSFANRGKLWIVTYQLEVLP